MEARTVHVLGFRVFFRLSLPSPFFSDLSRLRGRNPTMTISKSSRRAPAKPDPATGAPANGGKPLPDLTLAQALRRLKREITRREKAEVLKREAEKRRRARAEEFRVMEKQLRRLTRLIISAQEEERKRISRELHDGVVQTLVGINVQLAALSRSASANTKVFRARIVRTQRLVETSVNAVHSFARELRPTVLDDLGLIPALHAFSQALAKRKGLKIEIVAFQGVEALDELRRTVLFRVAQEALANVGRHAQATLITLTIIEVAARVRMEIADNGRSFEVDKVMRAPNPKRIGLIGMKERVEMVGGAFTVISQSGVGTTVCAEVPFPRAGAARSP